MPSLQLVPELPVLDPHPVSKHVRQIRDVAIYFPAYSWVLAKRLLSGWLVGKSCLSVCPSAQRACGASRAINRSAWREAEGCQAREHAPCIARPPCVSTAGEARQGRVYNTKEVCYKC